MQCRPPVWNLRCETHLGQQPDAAASTGRTYDRERSHCRNQLIARRAPSTYGWPACCLARTHSLRVFGDIADTSSSHGNGCLGGRPCPGARCRLWMRGVNLFDLHVSRERTGANCVVGSGSVLTSDTNGSPNGLGVMRRWRIDRVGRTALLREVIQCWKRWSSTFEMLTRRGVHVRSCAVWNATVTGRRRHQPCTRSSPGMAASFHPPVRQDSLIGALRKKPRIFFGRWTSRDTSRWRARRNVIPSPGSMIIRAFQSASLPVQTSKEPPFKTKWR